jgi:UDP-N-acetylmuramate--alanine ligase
VEADHLDHHGTVAAYVQAFRDFVATVTGTVVLCADDPGSLALQEVAQEKGIRVRTYGTASHADLVMVSLTGTGGGSTYDAVLDGQPLGRVTLPVAGDHQARNSAAALLAGLEVGLPAAGLMAGLAGFTGVRRRMELKGTAGGVRVYDDYAHHPTEVRAQLLAARSVAGEGRLVAAFQPHLYSRTAMFADAFGQALGLADEVVVMEVYGAREDPVPGVTGALVAQAVALDPEHVLFEPSWSAVPEALAARLAPGDLLVTLGAGDVTQIGPEVLRLLHGGAP